MSKRERVEAAFDEALERDTSGRSGFLAALRASEPEIAAEVEQLLRAHDLSEGILERAPVATALTGVPPDQRRIGPYRVVRELGRGGMGVVYLAERDDGQFRRRVAVKLLRSSPDADELKQRFLAERQILALLDHPNIAQLIDGGVTDGRLPYLVMEYVEGLPITQYCERHNLSLIERLKLFQDVCAAVHHAHRNLVIHRDLKPGNILVTPTAQVKLLDFGIAKLLNPGFGLLAAPVTWTAHRVLTPEYASPEQLRGEPLSTTSDVYALGVVLYELLTGRRPHESPESQTDLIRRICEDEPQRPSATGGTRELRGDVDAIVLMALRKEPNRRYGSADLMAQDIQRYLEGLPVLAHKGSRSYYVRKFVRRHRITVATAAIVALSLITGAGVALQQSAAARNERDRAQSALRESQQITAFLASIFQAIDPDQSRGQETTARELLRLGLQRADSLRDQPLAQARVLDVIGRVYHSLGDYTQARTLLERAVTISETQLGANHLEVAQTLTGLAEAYRYLSMFAEAESAAERALNIRMRVLGAKHPDVAKSMQQLALMVVYRSDVQRAIDLNLQAIAIWESAYGPDHPAVAEALISLGGRLSRLGRFEEAERLIRRAIAIDRGIAPEGPELANAIMNLAYLIDDLPGRAAEAETLYRQGLQMRRQTLGVDHPLSNYALGDLALFLLAQGRAEEALPLAREHTETARRLFGADNPLTAAIMVTYARALHAVGRLVEALDVARASLEMRQRATGTETAAYAEGLGEIAAIYTTMGRYAEAEKLLLECIAIRTRIADGRVGGGIALNYAYLSTIQLKGGRAEEAEQSLLRAFQIFDSFGATPANPDYQQVVRRAIELYETTGNRSKAEQYRKLLLPAS